MGKIREQRRKERKRRQIKQFCIRVVAAIALVLAFVFALEGLRSLETDAPLADSQEPETQVEETKTYSDTEVMQIVMVGDVLMHEPVIRSGKQSDGKYNFDHLFTHIAEKISSADLAIANQETIMGGPNYGYTGYPSFNTPYELADAEVKAGFDVLLFGTNHAYDKGENGILNCINYLETTHPGLGFVGINRNQEEQDTKIYTYEVNGITVAILNYTYGHNGMTLPEDKKYLVNELDEEKIRYDIRKAEEIADFTIVCPHWGREFKISVDDKQRALTNLFLEEGVDLVLGTHPHVIEPIETLIHENGNEMLVYYSLGNFVSGTTSTGKGVSNRMVGCMADVTIARNLETGKVEIIKDTAYPVVCHMAEGAEYTVYFLDDYTEDLASNNLIRYQDSEFSKELCEWILVQVWGEQ